MALRFRHIPASSLAISEPNPAWFGNPPNKSGDPTWTNGNWLKSRFHLSFAEYHDPARTQYGVLRVLNDDLVQPSRGFGTHPHANMEIATIILSGALTHQDSMGSKETLSRGGVQFMSAASGVQHSEHNLSPTEPLRFLQIWITPRVRGGPPAYGGHSGRSSERHNKFDELVADKMNKTSKAPVRINSDASIHVAEVEGGRSVSWSLPAGRQAYLVVAEGASWTMTVQGGEEASEHSTSCCRMGRHDGCRLFGPATFEWQCSEESSGFLVLIEMAGE